jgi:hypothetical protein
MLLALFMYSTVGIQIPDIQNLDTLEIEFFSTPIFNWSNQGKKIKN